MQNPKYLQQNFLKLAPILSITITDVCSQTRFSMEEFNYAARVLWMSHQKHL